jgi:16S rRNA (guanine527-N7)-methyltransferase
MLLQLHNYYNSLIIENDKYNLTALTSVSDVYIKHFYDSLLVFKALHIEDNSSIIDVGSGAGIPGLILKIVNNSLKTHLLDANNKKISFLNLITKQLNLEDVETIYSRAEDYARVNECAYDYVIYRAVAKLRILIEIGIPMLKVGGCLIAMKSGSIDEEIVDATTTLKVMGCKIFCIAKFELPDSMGSRQIIVIKKDKHIKGYPRAYATMLKKTL